MSNLGKCDYIGLYDKDAVQTVDGAGNVLEWQWKVPKSLTRRKSPSWYIKLNNVYLDSKTNDDIPYFIRLKVMAENYHTYEVTNPIIYPILTMLSLDTSIGHFTSWTDNPSIMISSNTPYFVIDIVDGNGNVIPIGNGGVNNPSLNLILEVDYPEHNEVRDNTVMAYAQSQIGNPPFNRL